MSGWKSIDEMFEGIEERRQREAEAARKSRMAAILAALPPPPPDEPGTEPYSYAVPGWLVNPDRRRILTPEERSEIVRSIETGDGLVAALHRLNIPRTVYYRNRDHDMEFRREVAQAMYRREYHRRRDRPVAPVHGTSGYRNYGCRCPECRAAWTAYMKKWRENWKAKVA